MTRFTITFDADLDDDRWNKYSHEEVHRNFGEALAAGAIPTGATVHVELSTGDVVTGQLVNVQAEATR